VPAFTNDQWLIVGLVFLLGLVVGMMMMAGGKWKGRYREEAAKRQALETENARLRRDAGEMDSLRQAAARTDRAEIDRLETERREAERRQGDRRLGDRRDDPLV
jgi:outer membrane murein-binding lipoprotein Lpp